MTPDALWKRHAASWSLDAERRGAELVARLADEVTCCDPNGLVQGRPALSDCMGDFQRGAADSTNFSVLTKDARLQAISGFFHAEASVEQPA